MKINRIVFLDYLRLIACFMVMLVHAVEPYYFDSQGNLHIESASDAFWVSLLDSAARCCVPLFVMTSCYLLFPLKKTGMEFFRRRVMRILVPFFVWSLIYVWHFGGNFKELFFNFPMAAGHLWFVPMLFGLYLAMPLLSPWAEHVEKRELKGWICLWLFTTLFPYLRRLSHFVLGDPSFGSVPFLWGECAWNEFGAFHYVSGFFGYMLLALYFRKFVSTVSWSKTLSFAVPLYLVGVAIMSLVFYHRIPGSGAYPVHQPYAAAVDLEMSIEFCSVGVVFATVGLFHLARKFTADGWFYQRVVVPMSEASYGAYLIHMIILTPVMGFLKGTLPISVCTFTIATITYISSMLLSIAIRRFIPVVGKYIVG
jgi:surface polysaccharide O-acyltransferase-like enzyme